MADAKISQLTAASTPLAGTEVLPIVQSSTTVKATIANIQAAPVSAGTASTVQYLNASKVPTTSSTLTYDGTSLGVGASTSFYSGRLAVGGHIAVATGNSLKLWNTGGTGLATLTGTGTNELSIAAADGVKFTNGNLILSTAGKGIDFSANTNAPGMTSELLNWYEEGTWTPAITCGVPGDLTVAYSSQAGFYTRVGRLVTVNFILSTSTFTRSTASGLLIVSGLPFAIPNTSNLLYYGAMSAQGISRANYTQLACVGLTNSSNIIFPAMAIGTNQNILNIEITDLPSGGAVILRGSLTYSV